MKKLVLLGCGKLNNIVADAILAGMLPDYELSGVYSRTVCKAEALVKKMGKKAENCKVCLNMEELLDLGPDILVEAASPAALREVALTVLKSGVSIVALSAGALADDAFYEKVQKTAQEFHARLYVVSGATGGFDVLQTATLMGNARAEFFNEKGPDGLKNTPLFEEGLYENRKTVFQGTASEAIRILPTRVNVTVAASRASVGPSEMQVSMQSTPGFKGDTQRVEIRNDQVHAVIDVYSKTSEIAGWSAVNVLRNLVSPIVFC